MKISVIIPTYNRENDLVETLKCLFNQDFDDYEILVIDQTKKHKEETIKFLEANKTKFKYIFSDKPSVTRSRNIGIEHAKGEILVFIDDDILCEPDFLKNHYRAFLDGYDVVQGKIFEKNSENAPIWILPWLKYKVLNNKKDQRTPTNSLTGCNFSVKKAVAEEVGKFDERFYKISVREDSDFGYRCYKAGKKMVFEPTAKLFHNRQNTGGVDTGIKNHFFDESF